MAGKRIDDHSSWIGAGKNGVVFPAGAKMKEEHGTEGDGGMSRYEDTNETIVAQQKMGVSKARAHPMKPGYRN